MALEVLLDLNRPQYVVLAVLAILVSIIMKDARTFSGYNYPGVVPGAVPILGNALQIPKTGQAAFFTKLANQHGEMMTLKLGKTPWLFLNSRRVVNELLQKRAAIYSSRQMLPMAQDIVSDNKRILLMPYNDLWRKERSILHQLLNVTQVKKFAHFQDKESRILLLNYLDSPEKFHLANSRYANSVIMSITFGKSTELDDPDLRSLAQSSEEFVKYLQPNSSIVDIFPFLAQVNWIPRSWQPWRRAGDELYKRTLEVYRKQVGIIRSRLEKGEIVECFMKEFFASGQWNELEEEQACFLAGVLMEAGSDTTRVSLNQLVAGSALWPDWIQRARGELDKVCGSNAERLPEFSDANDLPLIKAAVKETLRWKPPIAETGIPHAVIKDDEFEGYRIKAGTIVTWNHWAISNNEDEYKEAGRFWPDRFLGPDLDSPAAGHLGFGAGRRLCVGLNLAQTNMFLAVARLVYCFDFAQDPAIPIDDSEPLMEVDGNAPFKVKIRPRSQAHAALIRKVNAE